MQPNVFPNPYIHPLTAVKQNVHLYNGFKLVNLANISTFCIKKKHPDEKFKLSSHVSLWLIGCWKMSNSVNLYFQFVQFDQQFLKTI